MSPLTALSQHAGLDHDWRLIRRRARRARAGARIAALAISVALCAFAAGHALALAVTR